ncbi:MAG: hypothetical protein EOP00_18900 [Pedobacter sp.]|nr:MAG: hypothetical protein EOP00_18900 [Pedobacter sp.]
MKKFLKITAVIVLSLLIFFVGTFKYRQYKANEVSIPKNTASLIKISVDEIYKSIAANMISNPGDYFKSDRNTGTKSKFDDFDHGLKIPASIYLYTIKNQPKTAFFSWFEIKEVDTFKSFLKNILHLNIEKKPQGFNYAKSKLGNIAIYYNDKNAAIVFSNELADFEPVLIDVLKQKNFIQLSKSNFDLAKNSTGHLAFADNEHFATLNFDKGVINFSDEFISRTIIPAAKPIHKKFNSESTISFWLNADFKTTAKQTLKLKTTSLEKDSLTKYYKGYLDFEWLNTTQQIDSIITYDFNDDFEKVEKVTLKKRDIPNFVVNISSDAIGLKNYLSRQIIINRDSGIIDKSVFPLYKVFVGGDSKQLILSTTKGSKVGRTTESSNDFFALNINFPKLNKEINIPVLSKYLEMLKQLNLSGKVVSGTVKINGKLDFANDDINSLYQLLKSM